MWQKKIYKDHKTKKDDILVADRWVICRNKSKYYLFDEGNFSLSIRK